MKQNWLLITAAADGKSAIIDINGAIGFDWWTGEGITKQSIAAELKQIGAIKGDTIFVNINSYGGDVNDGISIHDLLAQNPAKKIVSINGMTASAATVIAMAGDEIKMSDNALFLVHRASTFAMGNVNDINQTAKDLKVVDDLMANIYTKRTKKPLAEIVAKMDVNAGKGEWLTAQEAKSFGFITDIFEPTAMAASADPKLVAKFGLPSIPTSKIKTNDTMKSELRKKFDALYDAALTKLGINATVTEQKLKDGSVIKIDQAGTEPAVGDAVTDAAGNPTPDQSYTMADDSVIKTDADSKISEITPAPAATEGEPAPVETAEVTALKAEIVTLKAEHDEHKADAEEMLKKMTALGKSIVSTGKPKTEGAAQFKDKKVLTSNETALAEIKAERDKKRKDARTAAAK